MDIINIGFGLGIIPVHFIYGICLYGVAIEDIFSLGVEHENESHRRKQLKLIGATLSIVGLPWLWSNTVIGLVCLFICSFAYSYCETASPQPDGEEEIKRDLKIYGAVKCSIRCMIGIWWSSSHYKLVSYLCLIGFIVKWVIVTWFREAEWFNQDTKAEENNGEDTKDENSEQDLVYGPPSLICLSLIHPFLFYKSIVFASKFFWRNRWKQRVPKGDECVTGGSPTSANHGNNEGSSSSSRDSRQAVVDDLIPAQRSMNVKIGGNTNQGKQQSVGAVILHAYRDVNHNYYGSEDVRRRSCSVLSFLACFLVTCFAIYWVGSSSKTTAETSSVFSNFEHE